MCLVFFCCMQSKWLISVACFFFVFFTFLARSKLRHYVPLRTLLDIYQSLIVPYITYGLSFWGQACKSYLHKILLLQKRALRFMYSAK